jgi:hypothetical protein
MRVRAAAVRVNVLAPSGAGGAALVIQPGRGPRRPPAYAHEGDPTTPTQVVRLAATRGTTLTVTTRNVICRPESQIR